MTDWDSDNYKRRHLRWVKMAQKRHQCAAREEKRKEEVLEIGDVLSSL